MGETIATAPTHLGILAGAGRFPFMVLEGALQAGCEVTVVGLRGLADPDLATRAKDFRWAGIARIGRWIRVLRRAGADRVILAGSVQKTCMYGPLRWVRLLPDWTAIKIWFFRLPDKRNDTVLSAVADEFARHGIDMEDCVRYSAEHLAPAGVLTKRQPTAAQRNDADFGWHIAKEMGRLDIGQSIAVKETEVIAVEAIEGTDEAIRRAGTLCRRGGFTVIKVAKPQQDMRFDVPTIGVETIQTMREAGGRALAIESDRTILLDRDEVLELADKLGISIVALTSDELQYRLAS